MAQHASATPWLVVGILLALLSGCALGANEITTSSDRVETRAITSFAWISPTIDHDMIWFYQQRRHITWKSVDPTPPANKTGIKTVRLLLEHNGKAITTIVDATEDDGDFVWEMPQLCGQATGCPSGFVPDLTAKNSYYIKIELISNVAIFLDSKFFDVALNSIVNNTEASLVVSMTADINTLPPGSYERIDFIEHMRVEIGHVLNESRHRLEIDDMWPGSLLLSISIFGLNDPAARSPTQVRTHLIEEINNPRSRLHQTTTLAKNIFAVLGINAATVRGMTPPGVATDLVVSHTSNSLLGGIVGAVVLLLFLISIAILSWYNRAQKEAEQLQSEDREMLMSQSLDSQSKSGIDSRRSFSHKSV